VEDWPRSTFADVSDTCSREKTRQPPPTHTRTLSLSLSLSVFPPSLSLSLCGYTVFVSVVGGGETFRVFVFLCQILTVELFFCLCVCVVTEYLHVVVTTEAGESDVGEDREFFKARASEEKIFFVHFIVR
jgi:hypothetical protein